MMNIPNFFSDSIPATITRSSLPAPLTSFVGRERELNEVRQLCSSSRLLTITGAGGVGKTRLALQLVRDYFQDLFQSGIWFVNLTPLHNPTDILSAIHQITELLQTTDQPLNATCSSPRYLLILDGCEHLVAHCASLVETLLHTFPDLSILVTSRELLGINGETVYTLPPLSIPPLPLPVIPTDLANYSATALFLERVSALHPYFAVTDNNASALVEICRQLDGLPLAIELAATWIRMMSVEQIAEQLRGDAGKRFKFLTGGSKTAQPHQQTLRASLDWSYALLSSAEQQLLMRLAVFAGGWTLEEAEFVCAHEWRENLSLLDGLARLINKSLVMVEKQPAIQTLAAEEIIFVEQGRYHFLETVRLYALEKLQETDQEVALRKRHLAYFLALAEKAEPALRGASQLPWLAYMDSEQENFKLALENARTHRWYETGLHLATALWWFWVLRIQFKTGRIWLEEIALTETDIPPTLRALALHRAGMLAFFQGDLARLEMLEEQSQLLFQDLKDTQGIAITMSSLVHVALRQGDYQRAHALGEKSVALARTIGDRWFLAFAELPFAILKIRQRDYISAAELIEEASGLFRLLGDREGTAYALDALGQLADAQHDWSNSIACYDQSLNLFTQMNDHIGTARASLHLGFSLLQQEQYAQASSVLEESLRLCRISERHIGAARALLGLSRIKIHSHEYQEAVLLLEESLYVFREHGDVRGFAETLHSLRAIACQQRQRQRIRLLLQLSLGGGYRIDDTLDVIAFLERIVSSEITHTVLAGRMRPAGWLKRVIGILQETEPPTERAKQVPLLSALTGREQEVLQLVEQGLSNAQIARQLVISVGTVRTHLASIYSKLGVASRTAAVYAAHEHHLL